MNNKKISQHFVIFSLLLITITNNKNTAGNKNWMSRIDTNQNCIIIHFNLKAITLINTIIYEIIIKISFKQSNIYYYNYIYIIHSKENIFFNKILLFFFFSFIKFNLNIT